MLSGVAVAKIIKSISCEEIPAFFIAFFAACIPKDEVVSDSLAILLSFIPVLSLIHSSLVSTVFESSSLVIILSGK